MTTEPPTATSEQTADLGCVLFAGPHRDFALSDAVAWREGDVYVIRSTEFDVFAEDEDFTAAIDTFVARLLDYAGLLHELVVGGDATPNEAEQFTALSTRLFPAFQEVQRQGEGRLKRRPRGRRRSGGSGHWRHRGTPASGSTRLSVA